MKIYFSLLAASLFFISPVNAEDSIKEFATFIEDNEAEYAIDVGGTLKPEWGRP